MGKIKKNIFYQTLYQILNILVPLVTVPIVTRALGPAALGNYSYTSAVVNYFSLFALLGLRNYGTREIARDYSYKDKLSFSESFWNIYIMQLILSSIVIIAYIMYFFIFVKENKILTITQGIILLVTATDITWFYFGIEEFKITVIRNIFVKLLSAILIVLFIKTPSDIIFYSLLIGGGQLLSNSILLIELKKYISWVRPSIKNIYKHFKPNLLLFIPVVAASFYIYIDKIMLGNMAHNYDVGYYEGMEKIVNIPNAFVTSIAMVMFPRVSALIKTDAKNAIVEEYVSKSIFAVYFFTVGCAFGLMAISDFFVPLFFGIGFEPVIMLLCIGGFILIPRGVRQIIKSELLLPLGKEKFITLALVIGAITDFILNAILIPRFQAFGAVIATLICEITSTLVMFFYTKEKWVYKTFIHFIPFCIFGGVMYFVIKKIRINMEMTWLNLLLLIIIGGILYSIFSILYYLIYKKWHRIR